VVAIFGYLVDIVDEDGNKRGQEVFEKK